MVTSSVPAGTVLYLDFSILGFDKPHFTDGHPVVVVNHESTQRQTGIAFVVPLTSELGNFKNPNGVEVTNASFVKTSPTGRSFAICDKLTSVPLQQLERYHAARRVVQGQNQIPDYRIAGDDLKFIRHACGRMMWGQEDYQRNLSEKAKSIFRGLFSRQDRTKRLGRHGGVSQTKQPNLQTAVT